MNMSVTRQVGWRYLIDDAATLLVRLAANPPSALAWTIFVVILVNVFAFVLTTSDPLVVQDAWYFLDVFVRHALDGSLTIGDFFVKRGGLDHAQPIGKLILLIELRHFHLDLRLQAVIGLLCAGASLIWFRWFMDVDNSGIRGAEIWLWCSLCVALVSLNSTGVWTWPLVAGGFINVLLIVALTAAIWQAVDRGNGLWLIALSIAGLLFNVATDDTAIIVNAAALLALAWLAIRQPSRRPGAIRAGVTLLVVFGIVRLGYDILATTDAVPTISTMSRVHILAGDFVNGGWWKWVIIPLATSVAYTTALQDVVGNNVLLIQISIGIILIAAHIWFWKSAFTRELDKTSFAAAIIMLTFYAICAGIIYGRVSMFGNNYLYQPRYILFYNLGNVALLLMVCAVHRGSTRRIGLHAASITVLSVVALGWQIPLANHAWAESPYISAYYQKLAEQIGAMARNPDVTPPHCLPELPLCDASPATRRDLIGLLKQHDLNIFSLGFQRINRLYPYPLDVSASAGGGSSQRR